MLDDKLRPLEQFVVQVAAKRRGHRPGKEIVSLEEMVDRVKAAVDARTDEAFVIMALPSHPACWATCGSSPR
jgi:hypothetical protein